MVSTGYCRCLNSRWQGVISKLTWIESNLTTGGEKLSLLFLNWVGLQRTGLH
jgi:hypothetical protein